MENILLQRKPLTILQQIEELKNWHKQQQSRFKPMKENNYSIPENKRQDDKENVIKLQSQQVQQNFDDMPIKVIDPNVSTYTENIKLNENETEQLQKDAKPKFRFLKKGEGIARFRMGPLKIPKTKRKKVLSLKLTGSTYKNECNNKDEEVNLGEKNFETDVEITNLNPPNIKLDFKNWKQIFDSGTVEEVIEKAISSNQIDLFQSDLSIDSSTASIMEKFIAVGRKHIKEKEELKAFEAIEQHLLDSSFCSNSSYVGRLMEHAVISTPIKKPFLGRNTQISKAEVNQLPSVEFDSKEEVILAKEKPEELRCNPPVWTNSENKTELNSKSQDHKNVDNLEQSLHVRFAEEVDYKSFIDCTQSINVSNTTNLQTNKEMFENEEWVENSEEESVCYSHCSTIYSSSDEDVKMISPLGMPPFGLQNHSTKQTHLQKNTETMKSSSKRLDLTDLKTKENENEDETSLKKDIDKFSPALSLKLKELENEIETFKEENKKLKTIRELLEKERKAFQLEKKKFLLQIEEEKKKNSALIEEEKQKLSKEKFIFEKYSKTVNKIPSKEERKEIQALKETLSDLKEELNRKESRWGAAQARVRNQVKVLEDDNKKLREEVDILRKQAKHLEFLTQKKKPKPSNNTKLIHLINDYISNTPIEEGDANLTSRGYFGSKTSSLKASVVENVEQKSVGIVRIIKENAKENKRLITNRQTNSRPIEETYEQTTEMGSSRDKSESPVKSSIQKNDSQCEPSKYIPDNKSLEIVHLEDPEKSSDYPKEVSNTDGTVEKLFSDGRREIRYKNGNIRRIDPFSGNEKLIYFNGDVKENLKDGTVKYFFTESRIWHTTLPDGLQVLDFPNGQVEKRHTNGMVEITYPNNCKKLTYPDKSEEIYYADGTKLKIEVDKRKILSFPNGQREIHTDECVQREYPDGTVKIVYPDGVTKTVYANGRVRLKDKDGNLVMDSVSLANKF